MSNALAIAAVTAVLRDLLQNALIAEDVPASVGESIEVSVLPPGRIAPVPPDPGPTQLNLFLYQTLPNTGWSNTVLPAFDTSGRRINNPPLALDLRYLLTAYGKNDLEAEILLGYGMQVLHETPILPREKIRKALRAGGPVSGNILPKAFQALSAAELADQVETIKISPVALDTEEMSRLWSIFQVPYRTTTAYHVSVVLIESRRSTQTGLPVRRYFTYALPFHQPQIDTLGPPEGVGKPVLAGRDLIITGQRLRGQKTMISLDGQEIAPKPEDVTQERVCIQLPATLVPGVHSVQVVHYISISKPPQPHIHATSNVAAFLLPPVIKKETIAVGPVTDESTGRSATVTFDVQPNVQRGQRILMLLNQLDTPVGQKANAYSFFAAPFPSAGSTFQQLSFEVHDVVPGTYLLRLQVDGAESLMETDGTGKYVNPKVTI